MKIFRLAELPVPDADFSRVSAGHVLRTNLLKVVIAILEVFWGLDMPTASSNQLKMGLRKLRAGVFAGVEGARGGDYYSGG